MDRRHRMRSRGAVLVEYALLLTAVAIPVMIGITAGAAKMLDEYEEVREHFLRPFP